MEKGDNIVNVIVSHFEELGNETLIYGDLLELEGLGGESKTSVVIKASSKMGHKPGDLIKARINVEKIHLFDNDTEMTIIPPVPSQSVLPVEIKNGKMNLFGEITKPESIAVDLLTKGTITLPLESVKVGEGNVEGKIQLVEKHAKLNLALIVSHEKKLFALVNDEAKAGDTIKFSVDYSQATFKDEEENIVCSPLKPRDFLYSRFVNLKTAFEETKNEEFNKLRDQRVAEVEAKYAEIEAKFNEEKNAALAEAQQKESQVAGQREQKKAELDKSVAEMKEQIKALKVTYQTESREIKAKYNQIMKETVAKIEAQYKKIWEDEKADYKKAMTTNKDKESRKSRKLSYQIFKESFPQMKANDLERKTNAIEFEKETEINGAKARYTQQKTLLSDTIKENERKFKEENYPVETAEKAYQEKAAVIAKEKKDEVLRAQLLFFFKFNDYYQIIPDDITNKIIQGLGNKVFTKIFRIEAPHVGYVEEEGTVEFKVVSLVNYGDTKMYKCVGQIDGEETVVYLNKEREIELGSIIHLRPDLEKAQIYEDDLNIRLY